ncbi:MAG: hypothetical protein ACR2FG_10655 [Marmoricola sp.]
MATLPARLKRFYGANPMHLLILIGAFALALYAVVLTAADSSWPVILLWFVGAVIGHDLVLFPLYAVADRSLAAGLRAIRPGGVTSPRVSPLNYLRIPALGTTLLLLLFFPGIIRQGKGTYLAATGQTQQPFLSRWLLLTAALFILSAVAYAVRLSLTAPTATNDRDSRTTTNEVAMTAPSAASGTSSQMGVPGGHRPAPRTERGTTDHEIG